MRARESSTPPKTMTWRKAMPIILFALAFDLARVFFNFFWLFGPALLAGGIGSAASELVGETFGGMVGGAGGLLVGYFGSPVFVFFGIIMAMAVGLLGWMTIITLLLFFNTRIFAPSSFITILLGFGISELPFVSVLPALTGTTLRLYRVQIRRERKALAAWQEEQAALQQQQQAEYMTFLVESEQARTYAEEDALEEDATEDEQENQEEDRAAKERATEEEENGYRGAT